MDWMEFGRIGLKEGLNLTNFFHPALTPKGNSSGFQPGCHTFYPNPDPIWSLCISFAPGLFLLSRDSSAVEQLIRNQQAVGSNPILGSSF